MNIKLAGILLSFLALSATGSQAAIFRVDFTVDYGAASDADETPDTPFDLPSVSESPFFQGYFIYDDTGANIGSAGESLLYTNKFTDLVVEFYLQTGSRIWTEAELDPLSVGNDLDFWGDTLLQWSFLSGDELTDYLSIGFPNAFSVTEGLSFTYCNDCISFEVSPLETPLPAAFWLFGGALFSAGAFRRSLSQRR